MNNLTNYAAPETPSMNSGVTTAMSQSREAQEVQAAVFMAKNFPRNENAALSRISQTCQRVGLASKAVYTYPRGGQNVTGPSIRLAEAIAQAWGNLETGAFVLERRPGETVCAAYCWDVETNFRDRRVFTVSHTRQTKNGVQVLTDPRDIYEMEANQMARRKRACILTVIPKDVVDYAVDACQKTLSTAYKEPLIDRLRNMVNLFQKNYSVPLESIEKYMGYKLDAFTEMDGVTLAGVYNALKDGTAKREDYFVLPKAEPEPAATDGEKRTADKPKKVSLNDL